jgi:Ca-activated chloride channel homolog
MSLTWARPLALLLLLLIPLYPLLARRRSHSMPLPRSSALRQSGYGSRLIRILPGTLRTLVLIALVLALAGPSTAGAVVEERSEGIPIVIAVDVSSSMLAQDFRPRDRLTVAKSTIASFTENRPGDPIGLVAFAAEALTLVPATTNRPVLQAAIESLQIGLLEDGTAIGDGLAAAVNRLRHFDGEGVIILLSDGESNRGTVDALDAARAAATLGLSVYTIGVGSESVAPVPVGGGPAGYRYAELPVGLDEDLLMEVASLTGGRYFRATEAAALERIYQEIDQLVPSVVETTRHVEQTSWVAPLLLLGGLLLISEWSVRGSRWGVFP